jgi:G3E family GTPase
VLNKCDLVTNELQYQNILSELKSINPFAPVARSAFGQIDLGFCFHIGAYES